MSRILQLVTRDEPGGVQVLAKMVADGLQKRGHRVDTIALSGANHSLFAVVRHVATGAYDAILTYQVAASLVGSLVGWISGVPLRVAHLTAIPSAMRPVWRQLDRLWGAWGLHSHIVANSEATAATVAHYPAGYRRRVLLIAHGVPALPSADATAWREMLSVPALAPLLVASGRLASQKDHATAIEALAFLPGAHLAIAGDGPLRDHLLALAADHGVVERLHLLGNLDQSRLSGLLKAADVCVFPSLWESFGLATVEAGMLGVPVVVSDLPVLREVLQPATAHGMVRFHPVGDSAKLATAVGQTLAAYPGPARRRLSARALTHAHAVSRMIDRYGRLIARDDS